MFDDAYKNFTASSGWLNRWKTRHIAQQLTIIRQKLSAAENAAKLLKLNLSLI